MTNYRAIIHFIPGDDPVIIDTDSYVLLTESVGAIYREFRYISVRKYEINKDCEYVPMRGCEK